MDDYNLPTLFSIEKVDPKFKDEELILGQRNIFDDSKSKNIFKRWRAKYLNLWVIKKVRVDRKIELKMVHIRGG